MPAGHYYPDEMTCCACNQPIGYWHRQFAIVWMDPAGIACVAHRHCLKAMGERDLDLPPTAA